MVISLAKPPFSVKNLYLVFGRVFKALGLVFLSLTFYIINFCDSFLSLLVIVYRGGDSLSVKNVFAPVASRLIRCLLIDSKRKWSILELSKVADVSYGHAHKLVKTLMKMGFCRRTEHSKIGLANPAELLSRWASYFVYSLFNKVNSYYAEERDVEKFVHQLSEVARSEALKYALTLHAGAGLVSPFVRPVDVHFYVLPSDVDVWVRKLGLEVIEFGGNVHLVEPYDEGVFHGCQFKNGISVVSTIQLYVDLYNYPARGREAAEHLRREVIKF